VEVLHLLGLLLFQMDVVEVGVGDPKTLRVVVERGDVDLLDVLDGLLLQDDVGLLLSLKGRVRMHT
jgi:RNase P/RNase MRP subunit p30